MMLESEMLSTKDTKNIIKEEIDQMPDEMVEKIYEFIRTIKQKDKPYKKMHTYKLNGAFDQIDIRKKAYE